MGVWNGWHGHVLAQSLVSQKGPSPGNGAAAAQLALVPTQRLQGRWAHRAISGALVFFFTSGAIPFFFTSGATPTDTARTDPTAGAGCASRPAVYGAGW